MRRSERDRPSEKTAFSIVNPGEPHEASHLALALEISEVLKKHYPNHVWEVSFTGGALSVTTTPISAAASAALRRQGFGFKLRPNITSRKEAVRAAIEAGGAMLELFGYRRGAWDGSDPIITRDLFTLAKQLGVPNAARLEAEYFR